MITGISPSLTAGTAGHSKPRKAVTKQSIMSSTVLVVISIALPRLLLNYKAILQAEMVIRSGHVIIRRANGYWARPKGNRSIRRLPHRQIDALSWETAGCRHHTVAYNHRLV